MGNYFYKNDLPSYKEIIMKNYIFLIFTLCTRLLSFSQSTTVVISQVYGGGGTKTGTTAIYLYDYLELHNISDLTQDISSWTVQYASATGNFAKSYTFPANTTISSGQFFLLQIGAAGKVGSVLPVAPDFITTSFTLAEGSGKLALTDQNQTTALGCGATASPCSFPIQNVVDLVAYGAANNAEGGIAANNGKAITNAEGIVRKSNGCLDTDNNNNDFDVVTAPVPRNSLSPAIILPLLVTDFKVSVINGMVLLNWSVADETDIERYVVEKSTDGNLYISPGYVAAKDQTGTTYSFRDALANGLSYYRLKLVDNDGSFNYSPVITVNGKTTAQLTIYPNPAISSIILSYPQALFNDSNIQLFSFDGKELMNFSVQKGSVQTGVDITGLVKGSYIAVYRNGGTRQTAKFVKE
jgi:hypothetical protein